MNEYYQSFDFPIDHFGVVASPLIQQVIKQDSNRRARKSALHNLGQIAKSTKSIPRNGRVLSCGLRTNSGGELTLHFLVAAPKEALANVHTTATA